MKIGLMKWFHVVVTNSIKNIDEMTCSICLDYIIGCKIATCGHSFCDYCLSEWLIRKKVSIKYLILIIRIDLPGVQERHQKV